MLSYRTLLRYTSGPLSCLTGNSPHSRGELKTTFLKVPSKLKKLWERFGLFSNQPLLWNRLLALMRWTRQVKLGPELLHYQELLESFRSAIQNLWQVKMSSVFFAPEKVQVEYSIVRESHEVNRSNFHLFSITVLISAAVCPAYNFILTLDCCIKLLCHTPIGSKNTSINVAF